MICETKDASSVPAPSNIGMKTGYSTVCADDIYARTLKNAPTNEAALRGIERCAKDVRRTNRSLTVRTRGKTWFPRGPAHRAYFMGESYEQVMVQASGRPAHARYYVRVADIENPRTERISLFEVTF